MILRRPLYYELYPAITCDKKWAACTLKILVGMRQCSLQCGRQLRENLRKWQSPSVPQHRMQTAEWFCGGNTFQEWKATQWFLTVDSRKTWLCKERSMLRDNPKDHRTSRLAQLRWLIYNSTFGMSIKDPAAIYSLHFLSNFLLVLIPFVTYSPTSRMGSTRRLCVWCRHMVLPKFRDY